MSAGQPATVTSPPVTAAAARNGAALDRSGSTDPVPGRDRPGRDPPACSAAPSSTSTPAVAQHRDGHLDVRQRRHRLAVVVHGDALVVARAGQQQPGHELGGRRRVDHHLAAGQRAGAVQGERQPVAVDVGAERAQRVQHGAHRPLAGPRVAVEARPGRRRARRRAARTASRCRPARSRRPPPPRRPSCAPNGDPLAVDLDRHAERAQRADHQRGVPGGAARRSTLAVAAGERGEQQRPVGHRLRAGHGDPAAHRVRRRRGGPGRRVGPVTPMIRTESTRRSSGESATSPASAARASACCSCRHRVRTAMRASPRHPGPVLPVRTAVRYAADDGHVRSLRLDQGPRRPGRRVPRGRRRPTARRRADYNVAPTKHIVAVVRAAPARRRGHPGPGHRRAQPAGGALGAGAVLGEGPVKGGARMINARSETAAREARVPPGAERAALPDPGRRLVRVAARQGPQAAVLHPLRRRQLARHGRAVGVLEAQGRPGERVPGRPGHRGGADHRRGRPAARSTTGCRWCCRRRRGTPGSTPTPTPGRRGGRAARAAVAGAGRRPGAAAGVAAVNNVRNNGPELLDAAGPEDVAEPLQLDLLAGPNPS